MAKTWKVYKIVWVISCRLESMAPVVGGKLRYELRRKTKAFPDTPGIFCFVNKKFAKVLHKEYRSASKIYEARTTSKPRKQMVRASTRVSLKEVQKAFREGDDLLLFSQPTPLGTCVVPSLTLVRKC